MQKKDFRVTSKYRNYVNYINDLFPTHLSGSQMDIYFEKINNYPSLCSLSGRQMAVVAILMALQK